MMSNRIVRRDGLGLKIFEGVLYILFVVAGFYLAFLLRFGMNPAPHNIEPYFNAIPYIAIVSVVIFYIYNIVETVRKSLFENFITIFISLVLINIATIAIVFFYRGFAFPRSVFLIGFIVQLALIFISKCIILYIIKSNIESKEILIFASKEEAETIAKKILVDKHNSDNIKYICSGKSENIYGLIDNVDKIYIGGSIDNNHKLDIIKYCSENNKIVYLIPSLFEISLVDFKTTQINDMLLFKIEDIGLTYEQRSMKRILDIIVSLIGVLITLPLQAIAAICIKIYDGGPIFYKQTRVTENNKEFNLYKFRTMIVDAEKHTGPILATEKDPRITPIGRFLRASRLDELPQLYNVLNGAMSIVGPRPERPFFVEKFNDEIEEFKYRVFVKAGITGLAQILGKYSTDPETKAKYDLLYIKNYSLLLDIKIIFNTIKVMFIKDSSEGVGEEKKLDELFYELNLKRYEDFGVTKVE